MTVAIISDKTVIFFIVQETFIELYCVSSLVNDSEANFQVPLCCTYTSVTMKGLVTSLPPTTATRRIFV